MLLTHNDNKHKKTGILASVKYQLSWQLRTINKIRYDKIIFTTASVILNLSLVQAQKCKATYSVFAWKSKHACKKFSKSINFFKKPDTNIKIFGSSIVKGRYQTGTKTRCFLKKWALLMLMTDRNLINLMQCWFDEIFLLGASMSTRLGCELFLIFVFF